MIFTAHPETLDQIWPHALPLLRRFSEETRLINIDELYAKLQTNDRQLWGVERDGGLVLVVVTEVWIAEQGPICTIKIASGNSGVEALQSIFVEIENWARKAGCVGIEICGRKGWSRVLDGFKQTGVILEKDLRQVH